VEGFITGIVADTLILYNPAVVIYAAKEKFKSATLKVDQLGAEIELPPF